MDHVQTTPPPTSCWLPDTVMPPEAAIAPLDALRLMCRAVYVALAFIDAAPRSMVRFNVPSTSTSQAPSHTQSDSAAALSESPRAWAMRMNPVARFASSGASLHDASTDATKRLSHPTSASWIS